MQILLDLSGNELEGVFDQEEVRQALANLITNAVHSMPDGGRVVIRTKRDGTESVEVKVTDTGCGIPREDLPRIFEPFFTTKPGGTGLGLAVVKKMVDRHKGDIQVQSAPGQGTSFTLHLPIGPRN